MDLREQLDADGCWRAGAPPPRVHSMTPDDKESPVRHSLPQATAPVSQSCCARLGQPTVTPEACEQQAPSNAEHAKLRTPVLAAPQVVCLAWDRSGRLLASSNGTEATIWCSPFSATDGRTTRHKHQLSSTADAALHVLRLCDARVVTTSPCTTSSLCSGLIHGLLQSEFLAHFRP